MDRATLEKLSREVTRQFPEMSGIKPILRKQGKSSPEGQRYELTYKGKADLPGGRKISRIVRVIADESGHIIRISTSK
jgi:hypothetical protein